ncbi:MAG TPA: hypothetical protein VF691_11485 [Cytophagaceae bacterium]|jgi:hypothetical protein
MKQNLKFFIYFFFVIVRTATSQITGPDVICFTNDGSKIGTVFFEVQCNSSIVFHLTLEGDTTPSFNLYDEGRPRIDFFYITQWQGMGSGKYLMEARSLVDGKICATKTITVTKTEPPKFISDNYCHNTLVSNNVRGESLKWYNTVRDTIDIAAPRVQQKGQIFYVSSTKDNCESNRVGDTLGNLMGPAAWPITSNATVCEGEDLDLSTKVKGETIKWYASENSTSPIPTPKPNTVGKYTYFVTNSDTKCESGRITFVANILPKVLPAVTANLTICAGDNVDLATKVAGDLIKWYANSTATTTTTKPSVPLAQGDYTYYVTNTKDNCESAKLPLSISVKARTQEPIVSNVFICQGESLDLASRVTGQNIKWYNSANATTPIPMPNGTPANGTVTYYVTSTVGCESARVPISVSVSKPEPPVLKASTIDYCQNAKADSLSKSVTNPSNNKWYTAATGASMLASLLPSTTSLKTYSYYVSQTVQGCESDRTLLTVKINPSPRLSTGDVVLTGSGIDITAIVKDSNNAGGTFTYFKDYNLSQSAQAQSISTPGIYYVKSALGACSDTSTIRVSAANLANQTISFPAIEARTFSISKFPLNATSSAGLPIAYYSSNPAIASITDGVVSINAAGTVTITATQNGNATTNPALNVSRPLVIKRAQQLINLTAALDNKPMGSANFSIQAVSSVGLPLTYSLVSGPASITSKGVVTVSKSTSGRVTILVSQAGEEKFAPADTTFSFEVLSNILESKVFPEFISPTATTGISITAKSTVTVNEVKFYFKKITQNKFDSVIVSAFGKTYSPDLTGKIDEIGIRYWFKITYNTNLVEYTDTTISHTEYLQGLSLPPLSAGTKTEDYKIISVPLLLEGKIAGNVFDELMPLEKNKWRLFHYSTEDSTNVELSANDQILPGKGYWIISRNGATVNTGKGRAVEVDEKTPFKLQLKKGYNQIGNPYNFPISWSQIQNYNKFAGVDKLKIYTNTGWQSANTLQTFEGAYVFSSSDVNYGVPARKIDGTLLRASSERQSEEGWILPLTLSDQSGFKSEAGIGMKPDASSSKDSYDEITMPRFFKYLELNFAHPEYFAPKFSQDVIPESDNHVWNFTTESSKAEGNLSLAWDVKELKNQKKEFFLLDTKSGSTVNMKEQGTYRMSSDGARSMAIYYGDPAFINTTLAPTETQIMDPFPNPSSQSITIPYTLAPSAGSYHVDICLYDMYMKKLSTLEEGARAAGFYQSVWNRNDVSAGLYVIKVKVTSEDGSHKEWLKKVIVK